MQQRENPRKAFSMRDAAYILEDSLSHAGYVEESFYFVPGGFALVTRLEQIEADGKPKPEAVRWLPSVPRRGVFSLGDYLSMLFRANPGYYRVIVFVVTDVPFVQGDDVTTRELAAQWLREGASNLSEPFDRQPFTLRTTCVALIYEFEKLNGDDEPRNPVPGRLGAAAHLAALHF